MFDIPWLLTNNQSMNPWRQFWSDSRGKVILVLLALVVLAWWQSLQLEPLSKLPLAVFATSIFDLIWARLRHGKWFLSPSSVVTGLLIGLIFDPASSPFAVITAALVATSSKYWLRFGSDKHIFNPAALGIVVASLIFGRPVSWWGASGGLAPILITGLGMIMVLYRLRRILMPLIFLATYYLGMIFFSNPLSALRLTFDGTVFLFAWVMLPEPITSPARGNWHYLWGLLVGVLVFGQNLLGWSWSDPLLIALLVANVMGKVNWHLNPRS